MPYPNEHACRLEDPDKYDKLRRENCAEKSDGKCIDVIYGIKDNKSEIQALRYDKEVWSASEARAHCKERGGKFEAAADEEDSLMEPKREIRTYEMDLLEVREGEGETPKIKGHAAVFNKLSVDLGGFREIIDPGAFTASIKRDDVRALFNHDPNYILGRNKAKTLILEEDETGLAYEVDPPDTQYARDLMVSIKRGDINQCSFAFNIDGKKGERWLVDDKEVDEMDAFMAMFDGKKHDIVRHVMNARLWDVSPVTYAAYPQTDVKVRSGLAGTGIDYEELAVALGKRGRGEDLSDKEKATLARVGEIIRGREEAKESDERGAREKGRAASLARKRLNYGYPKLNPKS
jgi:HK97 family phage prohead protease